MQLRIDPETIGEDVPSVIQDLLDRHVYEMWCPDGQDEHDAYQHAIRGRCMTCGSKLGPHTLVVIDEDGVIGLWCGGQCLSDMHSISFLTQTMDNIVADIQQREQDDE